MRCGKARRASRGGPLPHSRHWRVRKKSSTRGGSPMPSTFRAAALAVAIFGSLSAAAYAQPAKQPAKQAPAKQAQPPQQAQPAQEAPPQIALTEQQLQGFVAATPEITRITSKLKAEPDKKTQAQLDALAKKGGFA